MITLQEMTPEQADKEAALLGKEILVVGWVGFGGTWGKGKTLKQAKRKAENPKKFAAYLVHPDTTMTDYGYIQSPPHTPPVQFIKIKK